MAKLMFGLGALLLIGCGSVDDGRSTESDGVTQETEEQLIMYRDSSR